MDNDIEFSPFLLIVDYIKLMFLAGGLFFENYQGDTSNEMLVMLVAERMR